MDQLEVYANLKSDTNLDINEASDMVERLSSLQTDVNERLAFIDEEATKIPLDQLEEWAEQPEFSPYKADMDYWIEFYEYGFDEERDALIAGSQRMSELPEEIFEAFHYLTDIPEIELYFEDFESDKAGTRAQAFLDLYNKNIVGAEILASALEGEVLANNYLTNMYDYEDAFALSLEADGMEIEDFDKFTEETKKGLVLLHRWKALERELVGLSEDEKLHAYDVYLPWIDDVFYLSEGIEFDLGASYVRESFVPLGDEYVNIYDDLMEGNIIDVLPRDTKVDGAYTWGTYDSPSYVLLNYYGDFEDVLTVGHEMGHAVHQEFSRKSQSYGMSDASVLTAEMAATTGEALMLESMLSGTNFIEGQTREAVLLKYADSIEQTIFMQLMASEFQRQIHDDAKRGLNLDAGYLNELWADLVQEYYGPAYEISETDGLGWTEMPHFYWGFYVQKYAIGYTAGISNAVRILEDPAFQTDYIDILKEGGSEFASDQLISLGYGPSGELAVEAMLERFDSVLDEIELALEEYR